MPSNKVQADWQGEPKEALLNKADMKFSRQNGRIGTDLHESAVKLSSLRDY